MKRLRNISIIGLSLILMACSGSSDTNIDGTQVVEPNAAEIKGLAKAAFGGKAFASTQSPAAFGSYAKGCLAGGEQLAETGATWQAMRLSRNRNWAHPEMIDMVQKLSRVAAKQPGWNGLYVGDMSQPRGGSMLTGHRSHQIGLDADIWMLPAQNLNLSVKDRENLSSISTRRSKGAFTNGSWTRAHHEIVKAAAKDKRVERILIFPGAKVKMCNDEKGDKSWLNKVRPWYGHHYHFHIRIACPRGTKGCKPQAKQPAGDGCADAQKWVDDILNPPAPKPRDPNAPKPKPRREYKVADLPQQCLSVLRSR